MVASASEEVYQQGKESEHKAPPAAAAELDNDTWEPTFENDMHLEGHINYMGSIDQEALHQEGEQMEMMEEYLSSNQLDIYDKDGNLKLML
mmetsp:Transcript_5504/g.20668  ORF Transcript_5504/g.20668 Transcript_5504/m.20668 type:complete len:91 (+) Transcript_5504:515-787(+)